MSLWEMDLIELRCQRDKCERWEMEREGGSWIQAFLVEWKRRMDRVEAV